MEKLKTILERLIMQPTNYRMFNDIGVILYQLRDYENSYRFINRAYELDKTNKTILYNYASILYECSKFKEAVEIYKECLNTNQSSTEIMQSIIDCYYILGKYELATKALYDLEKAKVGEQNV
ncbi:hypothetical protein PV797_07115 [Clostridiaceae bacterium M8S5]|nr:hypothetical protein PV797_07115 [Clostridiaceae bacterium M8S5]